jgi:hypothetical protein
MDLVVKIGKQMDFHDLMVFLFFMAHYLPDGLIIYLAAPQMLIVMATGSA